MTQSATIFHNPRCSKSRKTLALLEERGIETRIVEYITPPLTGEQITDILTKLGMEAHGLLRTKEDAYQQCRLSKDSTHEEIVDAICAHPILMERPIVIVAERAAIGRPPENILEIL